VSGCGLTAAGVRDLLESGRLGHLTHLALGRNLFGTDGVSLLPGCRQLTKLRDLSLASLDFSAEFAAALGMASYAEALEGLDLDGATFQPNALEAIAQCKLPALMRLKLNSVDLRPADAESLAGATWRPTLSELYLDVCRLGNAGVEALVEGKFPNLTKLDLSRNAIGTRGGIALANAAKNFPALTSLRLWDNKLTPAAVEALANSKLLANVTDFDLNANKIGHAGAFALAKSKHLSKLTSLIVDEKPVGKKGKQALLDRFGEDVVSFR
jgi:Ran GTPase-activating protein (RanGAP) involved in mRNA processing and transport